MTNRTKAIASLSGVFLLGAFIGALVVGIIVRGEVRERELLKEQAGFEMYIVDRLRLTEAQRDSLKDELERTFAELDELRSTTATEYSALLDTLKQRISPQLNPDQRALLSDMDLNFRRGFPGKRHGGLPPRRGGGPPPVDRPQPYSAMQPPVPEDSATHLVEPSVSNSAQPKEQKPPVTELGQDPASKPLDTNSAESSGPLTGLVPSLDKHLAFSSDQRKQVTTIVADTRGRIAEARKQFADDRRMQRMAVRRNLQEMDKRIQGVLTPAQLAKYRKLRPSK
jgi:hypothetical protein